MHWLPIDTAPPFFNHCEAIVGTRDAEGRWSKVDVWAISWSRENLIQRGATHYCRIDRPPSPEEDESVHDFIMMIG